MSKTFRVSFLALLAATLTHCSHGPRMPSEPDSAQEAPVGHDIETIAIFGTNDLHGTLAPQQLKTREPEGTPSISYQAGGLEALTAYAKILRNEFGPSMIWLDAGDEFQGSIDSNLQQGAPMVSILNAEGVQAAAVGNHEFDFGPSNLPGADPTDRLGALKARMSEAHYPFMAGNIQSDSTGKLASDLLPGLISRKIIDTGKVKVGVLGLATNETPRTTLSVNIQKLRFAGLRETTLREAASLRAEGAQIVVAVAHVGLKCSRGRASAASHVRKPTEQQGECGSQDELVQLLNNIPSGTLDAVVAGHYHQIVHHWVAGVPVIQGGAFGRYTNVIYLNYDLKQRTLLRDLSRIEGPIPVCPAVFQNQNDCNGERPAPKSGRGSLVSPKFHGETVSMNSRVSRMLEPMLEKSEVLRKEVIATAARPVEYERAKESPLGDLVTDAILAHSGAQVALMNSGGIRAPWEAGPITYEDVFRTLPFENAIVKIQLTGRELKTLLRIAESGSRGLSSVAGVNLRLLSSESDAPSSDLNADKRIEPWEVNRLLEAKFADGREIEDSKTYTLATLDFLVVGGDDMGWFMSQIPASRITYSGTLVRDSVLQHLRRLARSGPIHSRENPAFDPSHPRIKIEKISKKVKSKGKGRHKKRRK